MSGRAAACLWARWSPAPIIPVPSAASSFAVAGHPLGNGYTNVATCCRISKAFGQEPPDTVEIVGLFTDNDQTGEPVKAYYGTVTALPDDLVDAR